MQKDDLHILCERFTTSKLKAFEDLTSIATFGFRGEALASISHIAHLRVTTRTIESSCAWQAHYADGKLVPAKSGQSPEPKPCAGRPGTQLTVEDLFYNTPGRRRSFRSPSEEYAKILDVVTKYAVHCDKVGFSIKKHGESGAGFSVSANASTIDRIRLAYGAALARELVHFEHDDPKWGFKASGYMSNANYSVKRTTFLLFINHRSVDSATAKKALEQTYTTFLPKGGHPFIYLSLEIEPSRVDVNVHPTKREVHFLNEDEIIEAVCSMITDQLGHIDTSRTFKIQTILPGATSIPSIDYRTASGNVDMDEPEMSKASLPKKAYENTLVRTDSKLRKITSMLPPALKDNLSVEEPDTAAADGLNYETTDAEQVQVRLSSVKALRAEVREAAHQGLTDVFASLTYVGLVDDSSRLVAMQSGIKLYMVDYGMVSNEFFYQVGLTHFGNMGKIKFGGPLPLKDVLALAAKFEHGTDTRNDDGNIVEEVNRVYQQIMSRREMLNEYFSLEVNDKGSLIGIPLMIKGYLPCMAKLPTFLLRLGHCVNWTDEKKCFETFLVELASFYTPEQLPPLKGAEVDTDELIAKRRCDLSHSLEHVLFPAFRSGLIATIGLLQAVLEVADLKGLYRVFERC